ncbi:MAG: helix-turn-helix domain-containing protein [Bacteroidota bacterium]
MPNKTLADILQFNEMNDLYEEIGLTIRTENPDLHIYKFEDFDDKCKWAMPPHSKSFHQISFITDFGNSQLNINQTIVEELQSVMYFISPQHIYSWKRDQTIKGYIVNFKVENLPFTPKEFFEKFKYFDLQHINFLQIGKSEAQRVREIFDRLYQDYHQPDSSFSKEISQHNLLVLMYKCLNLFEEQEVKFKNMADQSQLNYRFQNLINNYYLSKRTVKEYAELLNITPNYLSERIKEETGQSALHFISMRLLTEAKNLLAYAEMDVKEIAYTLDFASPSHFGKFFKSRLGLTPLQYRQTIKSEK